MKPTRNLLLITVIVLAAAAVYYFLWPQVPVTVEDTRSYLPVAADLTDGQLEKFHFRTLGYPLILLLTGSATAPARTLFILQLVMYTAAVLMVSSILIHQKIRAWLVALFVLLAILPPAVEYTAYALPETSALFFLTLSFFCLYRSLKKSSPIWSIAAGLAVGIAAIIRPDYQLLPIFIALIVLFLFLWLRQFRTWLKTMLPYLLTALVCLAAYMTLNYIKFNQFTIAYFSGYTSTAKTVNMLEDIPESYGEIKEILIYHRNQELVSGASHSAVNYIYEAIGDLQSHTGLDQPGLAALLQELNVTLILHNPLKYLVSVGTAMANYLMPSASSLSLFSSQALHLLWTGIHFTALLWFVILLGTVIGSLVTVPLLEKKTRQKLGKRMLSHLPELTIFLIAVASVLYAALVSTMLAVGDARYHIPTMLLALCACLVFADFLLTNRNKLAANL